MAAAPISGRARAGWRVVTGLAAAQAFWRLLRATVSICMRYRVTGLAAEAGFFALLSMPPLVLGLAGSAAWFGSQLGADTADQLAEGVRDYLSPFLTDSVVSSVILPTLTDALDRPRYDLISIGFVLSLWSGSRALNVYLDTISIMYGQGGRRGIIHTRALSFSLYIVLLILGAITLPLILIGPSLLTRVLPQVLVPVLNLYWPVVTVLGVALLATLYHVSTPVRSTWRRDLPGALVALLIWVVASAVLRLSFDLTLGGDGSDTGSLSIYGPLTTPIVVLVWLYLLAIAVLIGAAVNAAWDQEWPSGERAGRDGPEGPDRGATLTPVRDTDAERWASSQRKSGDASATGT